MDAARFDPACPGPGWRIHPSFGTLVTAVGRRLVPHVLEATLIPMALFYGALATFGLRGAFVSALGWSYTAIGRRLVARRSVPVLLLLATLGLTVRSFLVLVSANTFVFYVQPIFCTLLTAAVFAWSAWRGRPLIARFAADFCPLPAEVRNRPAVIMLFRRLTYLWAAVNALGASVTLTLLLTTPVSVFVGVKTVASWLITGTGLGLTIADA